MKTTEYLDALKKRYDLPSDYALTKLLPVKQQTIHRYRNGVCRFDDSVCLVVAELLDLPEMKVIADIHAEREPKPEVKKVWQKLAKSISNAAAVAAVSVLLAFGDVADSQASQDAKADKNDGMIYIMLNLLMAWLCKALTNTHTLLSRMTCHSR